MGVKAISLCIGVDRVDASSPVYSGAEIPVLLSCAKDAIAVAQLAAGLGYSSDGPLIDGQATRANVVASIKTAAANLDPDGIFLLQFSGHGMLGEFGGPVTDVTQGAKNSCWVLYDAPISDAELFDLWFGFPDGSRVLVLSDSCHSGAVIRDIRPPQRGLPPTAAATIERNIGTSLRLAVAQIREERQFTLPKAGVMLLSACQQSETALDDGTNGLFTEMLLQVWNAFASSGGYTQFHDAVRQRTNARRAAVDPGYTQNPDLMLVGNDEVTGFFLQQKPFAVA
jgi:hypothetical protein